MAGPTKAQIKSDLDKALEELRIAKAALEEAEKPVVKEVIKTVEKIVEKPVERVVYRSDPKDKAEIAGLKAQLKRLKREMDAK